MVTKFDRMQIASVNEFQRSSMSNVRNVIRTERIAVPKKETFKYVFDNARKGNEMAAVLLDEWQKSCKAQNLGEEQIIQLINKAVSKIFK